MIYIMIYLLDNYAHDFAIYCLAFHFLLDRDRNNAPAHKS